MEKTAIQQAIDELSKEWEKYGMGSGISYSELISRLQKLLEVEKEHLVNARKDVIIELSQYPNYTITSAIDSKCLNSNLDKWYNEKYGTNEK